MSETLKKPNSIPAAIAAIRTLEQLGYTYTESASLWKPPLGKAPFLAESNRPFDGDTEETRAAFRAYDDDHRACVRTTWQIWRDACAYMAGRAVIAMPRPLREVWRWGGNGDDHLESMGSNMIIEITAAQLRAALGWKDNLAVNPSLGCSCQTCRPITMFDSRMVLCPTCGNKRCPHATNHVNACTGSNEPGQPGSSYPARDYPDNPLEAGHA